MRLSSSIVNGEPDPQLAFGIERLERVTKTRVDADIYIEAFGFRITRPRNANYGPMIEDLQFLAEWLSQYLNKDTEVHRPFHTLEPAFEVRFEPSSGGTTRVFARLQAYGTVDMYFVESTGPAIIFETTNLAIERFRKELTDELKVLALWPQKAS